MTTTAADAKVTMRVNRRALQQYATSSRLSQREIAKRAGVSHTLINQLITNERKRFVNMDTARRIERAFDAPPEVIFLAELYGG